MNKYCFIIPIYNHQHKLKELINALLSFNYPIILIDDGSNSECKLAIRKILATFSNQSVELSLQTLVSNQGKGVAVMSGLKQSLELGYTHGIQIDADFQHDVKDVEKFVTQSSINPQALICGVPVYDSSVPKSRLYLRYITHFWVWVHTLSFAIKDSMCGYRIYPIAISCDLINSTKISPRMNFDTEIIVRLKWRNVPIINVATKVVYHDDVPSNFRLFKDNLGITLMHTKLFFGMLVRLPIILTRKFRD
ncbi:MAG: glycosyltransferase family 2 protein [Proteobacteria bacterium]|nr:glycosyltransferase family 2 protein [Pseudomonadota bacterium]